MAFGNHLKKLREACGMSAQEIADRLDVKAERLRKWEQFDRLPKQEDIIKIEKEFGVPMEKIMLLDKMPEVLKSPKKTNQNYSSDTILELAKAIVIHAETILSQQEHIRFLAERAPDIAAPKNGSTLSKLKSVKPPR